MFRYILLTFDLPPHLHAPSHLAAASRAACARLPLSALGWVLQDILGFALWAPQDTPPGVPFEFTLYQTSDCRKL